MENKTENKVVRVETTDRAISVFENVNYVALDDGALVLCNRIEEERTVVTNGWFGNTSKTETSVDLKIVAIFAKGNWLNFYHEEFLSTSKQTG